MPQEIPLRSSEAKFLRHSRASGSFGDPWRSTEIHGDSRRFTEIHGDSPPLRRPGPRVLQASAGSLENWMNLLMRLDSLETNK